MRSFTCVSVVVYVARKLRPCLSYRGNVSAPGIFCDPCPTGGLLPLICWATLYGFAPWPPGHQQMF